MRALVVILALLTIGPAIAQKGAPTNDKEEAVMLKALEAKCVTARKAFFKNSKDAKLKKTYVSATFNYAEAVLVTPTLGPKDKYPKALSLYREVLKTDPKHTKAKAQANTIIKIYKDMGRPVPGGG
jgi:acyl-coenzyme A synthetase/AMP-(fatty) acid ligase